MKTHLLSVKILMISIFITLGITGFGISQSSYANNSIYLNQEKRPTLHQKSVLKLKIGEVKILRNIKSQRIAIGNPNILQVDALEKDLVLIGNNYGFTSLHIWDQDNKEYKYQVSIKEEHKSKEITLKKIIKMKVRMMEFRSSSLKNIGIEWIQTASGPTFGVAGSLYSGDFFQLNSSSKQITDSNTSNIGLSSFLGISTSLDSTLHFMEHNGDVTILAEPTLSCISGESASFLAGGEIPFKASGENGTSISFKEYGIKLEVNPYADDEGRISTSVMTEVSSVDFSVATNGVPGFLTRRTRTHVNVHHGQTIVISGLMSTEKSQDVDKLPEISRLPILGRLFQSQNFQERKTQLVIFLTPYISDPKVELIKHKTKNRVDMIPNTEILQKLNRNLMDINIHINN